MKNISNSMMERGCVAETSRSAPEFRIAQSPSGAPDYAWLLWLVGDDTAALLPSQNFTPQ